MPPVHRTRRAGLKGTPRDGLVRPGVGGYDYPRGPYGETGFPGSTPAAKRTHRQDVQGRKDRTMAGVPELTVEDQGREWQMLPSRKRGTYAPSYVGGEPGVLADVDKTQPRPKRPAEVDLDPFYAGRQQQPPARRKALTTGPERRTTPVIGDVRLSQRAQPRNTIAQRWKADPRLVREYRASPNPGKTGAAAIGVPSQYHPSVTIQGDPDGKPVPGMASQPGYPPTVVVQSRFASDEGAMEGYAMDRPMLFAKGGTPAPIPPGAAPHIRGGRYSGQRYYGPLSDQQQIGLPSDSFGIARRRGPRHRPVRFELPAPHAMNFYDLPPDEGDQAPDMIRQSPSPAARKNRGRVPRRGGRGEVAGKPARGGGGAYAGQRR